MRKQWGTLRGNQVSNTVRIMAETLQGIGATMATSTRGVTIDRVFTDTVPDRIVDEFILLLPFTVEPSVCTTSLDATGVKIDDTCKDGVRSVRVFFPWKKS